MWAVLVRVDVDQEIDNFCRQDFDLIGTRNDFTGKIKLISQLAIINQNVSFFGYDLNG